MARISSTRADPDRRPRRRDPIRIGVSSCLLGERVRYDGGHKEDAFLTTVLARFVEWVPVCPELELGLGVPREPMQLEGRAAAPRLVTLHTRIDHTRAMERFARRRVGELATLALDGYIVKRKSPSCGTRGVPVHGRRGPAARRGIGLFARELLARFPLLPVEDEGRLADPAGRETFLTRVLAHWRWRSFRRARLTRARLQAFHAAHPSLLLAFGAERVRTMERLLAMPAARPSALAARYEALWAAAWRAPIGRRQRARALAELGAALPR